MTDPCQQLLAQLESTEWFSAVGGAVTDPEVVQVPTWLEALQWFGNGHWEVLGYEQGVALQKEVAAGGKEARRRWKQAVAELTPLARELVMRKAGKVKAERELPTLFLMIVDYDVRHALLEAEFANLVAPGFFTLKANWYLQGHFPCGLTPEGKLVIC